MSQEPQESSVTGDTDLFSKLGEDKTEHKQIAKDLAKEIFLFQLKHLTAIPPLVQQEIIVNHQIIEPERIHIEGIAEIVENSVELNGKYGRRSKSFLQNDT